jgi:hypothetical protein
MFDFIAPLSKMGLPFELFILPSYPQGFKSSHSGLKKKGFTQICSTHFDVSIFYHLNKGVCHNVALPFTFLKVS